MDRDDGNSELSSIIDDFYNNRDLSTYDKVIDDAVRNYVVTDEFVTLPPEDRRMFVNSLKELKDFILKIQTFKSQKIALI